MQEALHNCKLCKWHASKSSDAYSRSGYDLSMVASASPVFVNALAEKGFAHFTIDFLMGGISAVVSRTAAAPIEQVRLLMQNQDEMIKTGCLSDPYKVIMDYFK
ncbi:unnamed protein product [Musa textilis]